MYLRQNYCPIRKFSPPKTRLPGNNKDVVPQPITTALSGIGISDKV
jgi:hypothetical protein